jgi:hypothetical protein
MNRRLFLHALGLQAKPAPAEGTRPRDTVSVFDFMGRAQIADVQARTAAIDVTAPVQKAIDAGPHRAVHFPAGLYKITKTLTVRDQYVWLSGAGRGVTALDFQPAAADQTLFRFSAGKVILFGCSLRNIMLYSSDTKLVKTAIELIDVSEFRLVDVAVAGATNTLGTSYWGDPTQKSVGLRTRGREAGEIHNLTAAADRPLLISTNPNHGISIDHHHFSNCYFIARANPCVTIEDGVNLTNVRFDGYQAWVAGTHGLYWKDTISEGVSQVLILDGIRFEQGTDPKAWLIYIDRQNATLQNLQITNMLAGSAAHDNRNGIYLRRVIHVNLEGILYAGTAIALDLAESSPVTIHNCFWQTGSTMKNADLTLDGSRYVSANGNIPTEGYYLPTPAPPR